MAGRQLIPPVFNALVNDDKTCDFQYRKFLQGLSDDAADLSSTVGSLSSSVSSLSTNAGYGLFLVNRANINQSAWSSTRIDFNNQVLDPDSVFSLSTFKYTPQVAGYYTIQLQLYFTNQVASGYPEAAIYKNGVIYAFGPWQNGTTFTSTITSMQAMVSLNGTTDFITGVAIPGTTGTINGDVTETYMTGWLVRPS